MAAADDIRSKIDIDQVAGLLGTDRAAADRAVDEALGSLLGTMQHNVDDPDGALDLTRALGRHTRSSAFEPDAASVDVDAVDVGDGEKIVSHVYSPHQVQQLGTGDAGGLIRRLLPVLAPIVMSYLADRFNDRLGGGTDRLRSAGSDPLGDLLRSAPGEGRHRSSAGRAQQPASSGNPLNDILGVILGGGPGGLGQPQPTLSVGSNDGVFPGPTGDDTGLSVDDATQAQYPDASTQARTQRNAGGALGQILKDMLGGG